MTIEAAKVEWDMLNKLKDQCRNELQRHWFEGRISGFVQWILKPNGWWVHSELLGQEVPVWLDGFAGLRQ